MKLDIIPHILWINLERSTTRKEYMVTLLETHKNTRIDAFDGLNETLITEISKINDLTKITDPKVIACACSHLKALRYFVEETDLTEVLIFEDDVSTEFLEYIPFDFSTLYSHLPTNWNIIQLAITSNNKPVKNILVKFDKILHYHSCTAYLIKKNAAKEILEKYYQSNIYDFSKLDPRMITSENVIYTLSNIYSIPIFTYFTDKFESTIHQNHLALHQQNKDYQLQLWSYFKDNIDKIPMDKYFKLFTQ